MTHPTEGQTVSFIGDGHTAGPQLGDHGRLLAYAGRTAGHVQWIDGARRGQVDVIQLDDVAPSSRRIAVVQDDLEDSLEVGPIAVTSARHIFDVDGSEGLLTMLASSGRLGDFDEIADEAFALVQMKIAQTASVREVLAELDDEESAEVIHLASRILLHDAFGSEVSDD